MATADEKLTELGHLATTRLGELPLSAHAIVLGVFVGGVILWLFGQKSMRLGFTLVGLFGGGFLGLVIPAAFDLPVPPLVGALIGGVLGLIVGATLFRATVATSLAVILAIVAPLVAAAAMGLKFESRESLLPDIELNLPEDKPDDAAELIQQSGQKVRAFVAQLGDDLRPQWEALPQKQRQTLIASTIVGALLGAGLGGLMPKRMAALMTGFVGAALLLPSGAWLLSAMSSDAQKWLPRQPLIWLAIWAVLGVIGALVQWGRSRRRADKQ